MHGQGDPGAVRVMVEVTELVKELVQRPEHVIGSWAGRRATGVGFGGAGRGLGGLGHRCVEGIGQDVLVQTGGGPGPLRMTDAGIIMGVVLC